MLQDLEKWKLLVKSHNFTKAFLIKGEEVDASHEFYFPPLIQERDALDHIMRAMFALTCPYEFAQSFTDEEANATRYATRQMDKAIGHSYRALFDAADWLSLIYREQIREMLADYSRRTISQRLPEFTNQIEPRIDAISLKIAELRTKKDIGNDDQLISGVSEYGELINELEGYWQKVRAAKAGLDQVEYPSSSSGT